MFLLKVHFTRTFSLFVKFQWPEDVWHVYKKFVLYSLYCCYFARKNVYNSHNLHVLKVCDCLVIFSLLNKFQIFYAVSFYHDFFKTPF